MIRLSGGLQFYLFIDCSPLTNDWLQGKSYHQCPGKINWSTACFIPGSSLCLIIKLSEAHSELGKVQFIVRSLTSMLYSLFPPFLIQEQTHNPPPLVFLSCFSSPWWIGFSVRKGMNDKTVLRGQTSCRSLLTGLFEACIATTKLCALTAGASSGWYTWRLWRMATAIKHNLWGGLFKGTCLTAWFKYSG